MKTMIAIPAMDQMHTWTVQCLENLERVGECKAEFVIRMQVATARNILAQKAIEGGFDRVLWIDSDMAFDPDMMKRLSDDLDQGFDAVTGLYFSRSLPVKPIIYKSIDTETPEAEAYTDYPPDALFPIAGCGFGGLLMRTEALVHYDDPPFLPFPHMSEDLSFCVRMAEKGYRLGCDSRVKLGHLGMIVFSEKLYKHP